MTTGNGGSLLVVSIEELRFAFPTALVQRVVRAVEVTPTPNPRPLVKGIISLHGKFLPVLDGRPFFGLTPCEIEPEFCLVVFNSNKGDFALIVDQVLSVVEMDEQEYLFDSTEVDAAPPAVKSILSDLARKTYQPLPTAARINGVPTFVCSPDAMAQAALTDETDSSSERHDGQLEAMQQGSLVL